MEINVSDTGIPRGIIQIAEQLPNPATFDSSSDITLNFSGEDFVFLTGLVLLASWRKALPAGVKVRVNDSACHQSTQSFITNTGFREIIDTGHEIPSTQRRIGRIPLQPITNHFSKEATVNDIVSIFDEYSGHIEDSNPFKVMISELCENVLAHSEFSSPGYICARVLENLGRAEITIADAGVGIYQSYLNGTNEGIKEKILKGASVLDIALDGLNSSKPIHPAGGLRSYYGFGLLVTRKLVEENRGQLFLMSGKETLHLDRYNRYRSHLNNLYKGTFIGIVLDLNNPLPLEEIYEKTANEYSGHNIAFIEASAKRHAEKTRKMTTSSVSKVITTTKEPDEEEIPIKKIELRHYGTELLTRDVGTAIRADIAGYLAAGYGVDASLEDVSDITPSVADEAFAKLAQIIGQDIFEQRVHIVGGTRLANRLVEFVLKTRKSQN